MFQPWRKAAAERVQPPVTIAVTGSAALAPLAVTGTESASPELAPAAALPGPSWRRMYQPWRRAAQVRQQPPPAITCTGSAAMAPAGVSGSGAESFEIPPAAAMPGPSWRRTFQPWMRAAQVRVQPPAVIGVSGSAALAPLAVAGSITGSPELAPRAAMPGPAWRQVFQPWRLAAQAQAMPPPVIVATGSAALAPMGVSGSASGTLPIAPPAAAPGQAWRRRFQRHRAFLPPAYIPRVYYVSPSGSDSNAGTSSSAPWQTVTKVNNTTLYPGGLLGAAIDLGAEWTSGS